MKRFIALYLLFLLVLLVAFYADIFLFGTMINDKQTEFTLWLLGFFLDENHMQGAYIWIHPHYRLIIDQTCNGMIGILFVWAALLAYPASWYYRLGMMLLAYILFTILNVLRIVFVSWSLKTIGGENTFFWIHDIIGNGIFAGFVLFIFVLSFKKSRAKRYQS
ncbi:MAG: hypothetical protein DRQ78_04465 [Epsilonproteobacteria bacterium]|nr:MAG: hypothetical protein DRQ78_04465 [Campylobacterota bacterium]